jgi:hypothetical protein
MKNLLENYSLGILKLVLKLVLNAGPCFASHFRFRIKVIIIILSESLRLDQSPASYDGDALQLSRLVKYLLKDNNVPPSRHGRDRRQRASEIGVRLCVCSRPKLAFNTCFYVDSVLSYIGTKGMRTYIQTSLKVDIPARLLEWPYGKIHSVRELQIFGAVRFQLKL